MEKKRPTIEELDAILNGPEPDVIVKDNGECVAVPRYRCLGEQILVKRIDLEDEVSPGGVVKPQIARAKSNRGIVMAIGEGRMIGNNFVPFNLEVGDTVLFSRHGGTDVELDGQMYILLHHKMIYMVENAAH